MRTFIIIVLSLLYLVGWRSNGGQECGKHEDCGKGLRCDEVQWTCYSPKERQKGQFDKYLSQSREISALIQAAEAQYKDLASEKEAVARCSLIHNPRKNIPIGAQQALRAKLLEYCGYGKEEDGRFSISAASRGYGFAHLGDINADGRPDFLIAINGGGSAGADTMLLVSKGATYRLEDIGIKGAVIYHWRSKELTVSMHGSYCGQVGASACCGQVKLGPETALRWELVTSEHCKAKQAGAHELSDFISIVNN